MNIVTSVNIDFTEQDMKQLILDKIASHDDRIVVENIEFTQKRNPTRMGVDVKAHIGEGVANNVVTETVSTVVEEEEVVSTESEDTTTEVVTEEEPVTTKTKLFGSK